MLLLGSGGREHALAWKLAQSPRLKNLFAMPGSDAIAQWAQCVPGDPKDAAAVLAAVKKNHVKLVFIGPEAPLEAGVADALRAAGIPTFGPGKAAARLETSKAYSKKFMRRHKLPTARFEVCDDPQIARSAAEAWKLPVVIKADGLAAGKGVFVCRTTNEALGAITELMDRKALGKAGETVVIEDGLSGPELSVLALVDGKDYALLPQARDHKRLKDDDEGPNTGGMGVYAPAPVEPGLLDDIRAKIFDPVMAGLSKDKLDYRGVLYAGLMLTKDGPKLLEFNCRFGDPETQALLPLLEEDLVELSLACAEGRLGRRSLKSRPGACVCVTLASENYPYGSSKPAPISFNEETGALFFHAGTEKRAGKWWATGGRVLGATALGADLAKARDAAYAAAASVSFDGMQYRKDIAAKELSTTR